MTDERIIDHVLREVRKAVVGKDDVILTMFTAMLAGDKFWHSGVAVHPGDEGMHAIADRLYKAVLEVENA